MLPFDFSTTYLLTSTLIVIILVLLLTSRRPAYSQYAIPPFPVKPWPFVGHLFFLKGNLRDKLRHWRQTTGEVFCLDFGGRLQILVHDFQLIKDLLIKHADKVLNLPPSFANEVMDEVNTGIFSAKDQNWKEQRSVSLAILRKFGLGKNVMAKKIEEEVQVLMEKLEALKGKPSVIRLLLNVSVANVISSVIVGKRFDYDDPEFNRFMSYLNDFVVYIRNVSILTPFKFLYYLPGDVFRAKRWERAARALNEQFCKPCVSQLSQEMRNDEEPENFVAAYIQEIESLKEKGQSTHLDMTNLIVLVRTLFTAGTETTSNTILWCLLFMLHHPEVQDKVHQEILTHVGTDRPPNMADKSKLIYLNAVIMETQRRGNVVPIALVREVSETFEIQGYTFPKGSVLWPMLDSVHHDQKIWVDPDNFRPERFIDENGALINREELIPFSIGKRVCLGESLARMELFLYLATIFQRFRVEPENQTCLPSLEGYWGTTVVPEPFKVRLVVRSEPKKVA